MDRGERRARTDRVIRKRIRILKANSWSKRWMPRPGRLKKQIIPLHRCDCDGCSFSRQGLLKVPLDSLHPLMYDHGTASNGFDHYDRGWRQGA